MNRIKNKNKKPPVAGKKVGRARKYVRFLNVFGFIKKEDLLQIMPFIFFMTFLAIIYIANNYMAEKTLRRIDFVNKELKTLRSEHISLESELNYRSKQSAVARAVSPIGIKESIVAPKKIIVSLNQESPVE